MRGDKVVIWGGGGGVRNFNGGHSVSERWEVGETWRYYVLAYIHTYLHTLIRLSFVWRFYALSAFKAIFRVRTYSVTYLLSTYSVRWWWLYLMYETRRKPTTRTGCLTLFDKWPGIFCMVSRTDTAGYTCIYPVRDHWGGGSQSAARHDRGTFEPTTCRSTVKHANHQTTMIAPTYHNLSVPYVYIGLHVCIHTCVYTCRGLYMPACIRIHTHTHAHSPPAARLGG